MRFLVVSYGLEPLDFNEVGDAAVRSHRWREQLIEEGKIIEHAHISGHRGHMWIYDVDTVDELDQIVSEDPMSVFSKGDPLILPLTSYERMDERERKLFGTAAEEQGKQASLASSAPTTNAKESRFLVIAYGAGKLDLSNIGDAPIRANRYREELIRQGKISVHAHIAGQRGHLWIYHVASVDELDRVISDDPMAFAHQGNPLILPLTSYQRMHEREKQFFGAYLESD